MCPIRPNGYEKMMGRKINPSQARESVFIAWNSRIGSSISLHLPAADLQETSDFHMKSQ